MPWLEFLQGLMIPIRADFTISLWAAQGVPFQQSLLVSASWTSLGLMVTYFGTGTLTKWFKKWPTLKRVLEKWEVRSQKNSYSKKNPAFNQKLNGWVVSKKPWVILFLAFCPYTYLIFGLGTAVIAAAKLLNIRYLIFILLLGNFFRWGVITYHVYQAFGIS